MLRRIVSGGQTGADQGGLEAGRALGLETGGTAPKGWLTEDGPQPELLRSFGLRECTQLGYPARTRRNILTSDATVVFGNVGESGSRLTCDLCRKLGKFWAVNPNTANLLELLEQHDVKVLNVAGNRESKNPGVQERVKGFLIRALEETVQNYQQPLVGRAREQRRT